MSTKNEEIFPIGHRLRDERKRIGLSQEAFGDRIGKSGRTVKKYEADETYPDAGDLRTADLLGIDVLYVVTGRRQPMKVMEPSSDYTPAGRLAREIESLSLSEADADLTRLLIKRLATTGG